MKQISKHLPLTQAEPAHSGPQSMGELGMPQAELFAMPASIASPDVKSKSGRLHEIDGIRGWAALSVLLYHLYIELFIKVWPEVNGFWPRFVLHGPLAVSVFFVLSGDALSSAYFERGRAALDSMVVKRYFRLTLPILISCGLVWALMQAGLVFNLQAAHVLRHEDWLGKWLTFEPTLISMLYFSLYKVYAGYDQQSSYNPFLWTMSIELVGSALVFLYLYLHERLRYPKHVLSALVLFCLAMRSCYALFFMGVLIGIWRREGMFDRLNQRRGSQVAAMVLMLSCFAFDAWDITGRNLGARLGLNMVQGVLLVMAFYSTGYFKAFFSSRFSRYLGDISFSLYLIHFAVLVSVASWCCINWLNEGAPSAATMTWIATGTTLISVASATMMWRVEARLLTYVARLPKLLFKRTNQVGAC